MTTRIQQLSTVLALVLCLVACSKEYSLEGGGSTAATGTLKNPAGVCNTITIAGNYRAGTPTDTSNYLLLTVNVLGTGNYRIFTSAQNGVSFADSGFFSTTGTRIVRLKASGTPTLPITSNYTVTFDTSVCSFSITYTPSTGGGGGGTGGGTGGGGTGGGGTVSINDNDSAWSFSVGSAFYHGPFDLVSYSTSPIVVAMNMLGSSAATGDTTFTLTVGNTTGAPVAAGAYNSNNTTNAGADFIFANNAGATPVPIFWAGPSSMATTGVNLTVNVVSYNTTTRVIEGTFSGTVRNSPATSITITNGKFKGQHL
ncbi:MAG: hypothetical protein ACK4HE_01825 [Chitinophagaceae bacterium]